MLDELNSWGSTFGINFLANLMLLGVGTILFLILGGINQLLTLWVEQATRQVLGPMAYLLFFGGFGTILHELAHWLTALAFGHKIKKVSLIRISDSGPSGEVVHTWDDRSWWQRCGNFFIAMAPMGIGVCIMGTATFLAFRLDWGLLVCRTPIRWTSYPDVAWEVVSAVFSRIQGIAEHLFQSGMIFSVEMLMLIFLGLIIGACMRLSWADIKGMGEGGFWLLMVLFIIGSISALIPALGNYWRLSLSTGLMVFLIAGLLAMSALLCGLCILILPLLLKRFLADDGKKNRIR